MTPTVPASSIAVEANGPVPSAASAGVVGVIVSVPGLLAIGVIALGLALSTNYGQFHPQAMPWLAVAVLACLAAARLVGSRRSLTFDHSETSDPSIASTRIAKGAAIGLVGLQLLILLAQGA